MYTKTQNTKQKFHSVMKNSLLIATLGITSLNAGMFDSLTAQVVSAVTNEAENKVDSKVSSAKQNVSNSATKATTVKLGTPSDELVSMTECTNLKLSNVMIGQDGQYTFKNGFKKEKRSGFIQRRDEKASKGCILPSLQSKEVAYLEVDAKKFKALGNTNSWAIQCIKSANPDAGALENEYPREGYLSSKAMMLHCGNSEGIKECAKGSNSSRAGAWDKKLKKNGKIMFSVKAITATLAPKSGEKAFCQYYNSDSGKSLFAFEYIRAN